MKSLFIVRHGETEWNVARRMQGRLDSPLTDKGREQASVIGELIKKQGGVDHILVSPSGRTLETAYLINSHVQSEITEFEELMERDCGEWSGLTVDEVESRYADDWRARLSDPYGFRPTGGENLQDMSVRVRDLLEELYAADVDDLIMVTHGVMSKIILQFYLNLSDSQTAALQHPNELIYRLLFTAESIAVEHFVDGRGPVDGLMSQESIVVKV